LDKKLIGKHRDVKLGEIANHRLVSQRIAGTEFISPVQLVAWMGAMQAQDYAMVKWAVGLRLLQATDNDVEDAINKAEILRIHVMRPTWHLVSADDIYWMLDLTAQNIKRGMQARHKELGLTEALLSKSRKVIEKTLRDGISFTRDELIPLLNKAGIPTDQNRASHIFASAELDGLICSGVVKHGKQTFALLNDRVPKIKRLSREEALSSLAKRYFTSHGPATLDDFNWWSGLSAGDSKRGLDMVKPELSSIVVDDKIYWFAEHDFKIKDTAFLLPAFDEFIISYKDRSATLTDRDHKQAVSSNGIFHHTVVINGETVGVWKRTIKKDSVHIGFEYFAPPATVNKKISAESNRYAAFLGKVLT
jgi:hypothetical protein